MFEALAARLLTQITGRFCKNVDAKDLSISAASGRINLKNVEVKPSAFDDLRLPITVKSGTVGSIEIQVSWTKLTSSPIVVVVKDVFVIACPNTQVQDEDEAQPSQSEEEMREARREILRQEMEQQKIELLSDSKNDGADAGLAKKMLNNLQLLVQNVHIRYEQEPGEPGKDPVIVGVRLDEFNIASTNAQREPIDFANNVDVVYKKVQLVKLRAYVHNLPRPPSQAGTEGDEDDVTLVLKGFTATAWVTLVNRGAVKMKMPKIDLEIECGPLNLIVSESAVCNVVSVIKTGVINKARAPYLKLRPKVGSYRGHYRTWWQYAYARALDLVRLRRKQISMSNVKRCISAAVRYSQLYKRALGVLPLKALSKAEEDEFVAIQDAEPLSFLRLVQDQAHKDLRSEVQAMLAEAEETPQPKKGMMASMFGSSQKVSKVTVGGEEVELTDEQLKMMRELAASAAEEAFEAENDLQVSPEEYVAVSFSLSATKMCVEIVQERQRARGEDRQRETHTETETETDLGAGRPRIAVGFVSQFRAELAKRKQGFRADLRVGEVGVLGADETQKVVVMADTESGAMITFTVDSQPLGRDVDVAISSEVRPCYLNLSPEFVKVLGAWARDIRASLAHASSLADRTKESLAKVARKGVQMGEDFAKIYAAPEKRIDLKMNIAGPTILLPCLSSGLGSDADSMAVVNMGDLSINSGISEVTTGDRYNVKLSKVNVHLCSTETFEDNKWEDDRFKIFQTPVTVELEIGKPCPDHPHLAVGVLVAAIDAALTKAHVLHALAVQATLREMFPTSDASKARTKKERQMQQIQQHKIDLVRQDIKTKLAHLKEHSAGADGEVEKETGDAKRMEVKVMVERLSLTLKATEKEAEKGDIWSRRVTPEQSLRLKMVDYEMQLSTWDKKAHVLKARLHAVSLEHLGQDASGAIEILCSKKHNAGMRRLLQMATKLEEAFLEHDKNKNGHLEVAEVRHWLRDMNLSVSDEQFAALTTKLDADGNSNGMVDVEELVQLAPMLCSTSAASLDSMDFTMPLPSDIAQQPEMESLRVTIEKRADIKRANFKLGRVELTISSIPLRNAFDWMHLLQGADAQASTGAEAIGLSPDDEDTQEMSVEEEKAPGIAALRKSFESDSEDIYVPPTLSSILTFDVEEIDAAVHDVIIGTQEVLFFRVGPLSLVLSGKTPTDDKEPYKSEMQVSLKRLRVLYGQSLHDMEWDLTEVVSETALTFSSEESMPQDLSGAIKEQRIEIPDKGIRSAVSLRELLFLQALQKTFSTASQGIAGLESLAQAEHHAIRHSSSKLLRGRSSKGAESMSIDPGFRAQGKAKGKFQRNIAKLTRCFKCPSIELDVIDDLPDVQEQDARALVSTIKLFQCRVSQILVSELLGDQDDKVSASIAGVDVQAQAVGNAGNMETLIEPFPLRLEISTSRYSTKQELVCEIPSDLEITITPDHIERPRETMQKFVRHIKKQQLLFNLTIKANIKAGLEKLGGEVEDNYRQKMFTFLSSLSPVEQRQIRNRTSMPILCRVYPAADCDTLKAKHLIEFVLPPGGSVMAPTQVLSSGVLIMQPCRRVPVAPTDPSEGLVWLSLGSTEPNTGQQLENASLADALTRKTRFTSEEWNAFGINNLRVEHFVKASTGFYFKPAPHIQWAMGTWSKPEELRLEPSASVQGARYISTVEMEVQISMEASKVASIMTDTTPQVSFKADFERAVCSGADNVKEVKHRFFRRAGEDLLLVGFSVTLGSDSEMGGILMDFGDSLTYERLAQALQKFNLIRHEDDLSVLKEPTFERTVDCTSLQIKDATFIVASGLKHVNVTAPWKLSNKLPKSATFQVFACDDPNTLIATQLLEPGQKMMRFSPLTSEAGVWIQIELDGYHSTRHHLARASRHEECPLLHESGDKICCMLDTGFVGHSAEFVVTFYMKMVIINRTGLNLAFGCCRLPVGQAKGGKTGSTLEQLVPSARTDEGLMTRGKDMSRQGNDWVIKHSLQSEANPWNKEDPEINLLHLPENLKGEDAWRPCVNMAGDDAWTEIQATQSGSEDNILDGENDDEIFDMQIPGPAPTGDGPQDSNFTYRVGVLRKRGITPFQCTTYLTLLPKYTFVNDTGLSLQICQAGESARFEEQVLIEIRDGRSMSTLGLFREFPAVQSAEASIARSQTTKVRIRLLQEDGTPRTKWSQEFGIDEGRSVPLRLLRDSPDIAAAVEDASQCVITSKTWEAATFVEIRNVTFIKPMYQIKNSCVKSKLRMRIWQPAPASPLGREGAMEISPGEVVAFSFDNPDADAMVEFEVDGSEAKQINVKHPSQNGILLRGKVRYRTSISGYTRKLQIYETLQDVDRPDADATLEVVEPAEMKTEIKFSKIGVSIVSNDRHEISYASVRGIAFHKHVTPAVAETRITVDKMQVDNQTAFGQPVVFVAGDEGNFAEMTFRQNLQVTAMPYFEDVQVNLAPFTVQFHEVYLQRLLNFEHDAMYDEDDVLDVALQVSDSVKYRRRALIGVTREDEVALNTLSFLGDGVKLRQQFFRNINLKCVAGTVSAGGLSSISLREPVEDTVGPISKTYLVLHSLGQRIPIPELDRNTVTLPEYAQVDKAVDAGSAGLGGMIFQHYKSALVHAGLGVLRSGAAWSEMLMSAAESSEERLQRQADKAAKLSAGADKGGVLVGLMAIGGGFWGGLSGAFMKPLEGAQEGGIFGFFGGMWQGLVGVVTKPLAGVVAATKAVLEQESNGRHLSRLRTPRAVFGDRLLRSFDEDNAAVFWQLSNTETKLRAEGKHVEADVRARFKQTYMGYARLAEPAGSGLLLTIEQIVLVAGEDFVVQREIPMTHVREAKAVGEDNLEIIVTTDETPTVLVLAAGWKSNQIAMLQETIMYLAHQAARKHHSAPDIADHQLG